MSSIGLVKSSNEKTFSIMNLFDCSSSAIRSHINVLYLIKSSNALMLIVESYVFAIEAKHEKLLSLIFIFEHFPSNASLTSVDNEVKRFPKTVPLSVKQN